MIYLTKDDLITHAFEQLINESSDDFTDTLINIELENIELIKSYLGGKYNVDVIFDPITPVYNQLIARILAKLMLYDIVRRNAARKVPTDYKEEYEKAIDLLEKLATGRLTIKSLPVSEDNENGNGKTIWGNNSNKNFYI